MDAQHVDKKFTWLSLIDYNLLFLIHQDQVLSIWID